jgi:hypothetical protein
MEDTQSDVIKFINIQRSKYLTLINQCRELHTLSIELKRQLTEALANRDTIKADYLADKINRYSMEIDTINNECQHLSKIQDQVLSYLGYE